MMLSAQVLKIKLKIFIDDVSIDSKMAWEKSNIESSNIRSTISCRFGLDESYEILGLSPGPLKFPAFQCYTLKSWEGPGDEANVILGSSILVILNLKSSLHTSIYRIYSRKYWREIVNLAVGSQIAVANILADLAVRYRITIVYMRVRNFDGFSLAVA